jgi:hypothetical protein
MDETTQSGPDVGAWALSKLGYAIDIYTDRQLNTPQVITDHSSAYGMDSNGNLYKVGQPTTVQTVSPVSGAGGSSLLLIVLVLAFVASHHGR